jgi:hypothetical protein
MWRQSRSTARTWRGWLGAASPDDGELELLRAALVPGVEAHAAWMRWRATHALDRAPSRSNEILSAVGAALPEEVLGKDSLWLRRLRRQIWVQNQLLLRSLGEALVLLTEHGVPTTVVKGAALVSDVYPELGLRAMGDTDFVVGPDHFDRALDMLTSDGWTLNNEWFHAADLVDAQGYETDVHRWPLFPRFTRTVETGWPMGCWGGRMRVWSAGRSTSPRSGQRQTTPISGLMSYAPPAKWASARSSGQDWVSAAKS